MNAKNILVEGLKTLQIDVPYEPLLEYVNLLNKWNRAYNLTAIRDVEEMITLHLLDSLAVLPWVKGHRVVDVGTGAGLPGIPLAIANPSLQVVLLDSNGKKTRFLQEAKRVLGLSQIEITQTRVEAYRPSQGFDTVVSRAFSDLTDFINKTDHLLNQGGIFLAMKGKYPEVELNKLAQPHQVMSYHVPDVEGERCCVIIEKD